LIVRATRFWAHPFRPFPDGLYPWVLTAILILLPTTYVIGVAALVVRFALSSGDERLQLKWFAAAALLVVVATSLSSVTNSVAANVFQGLALLCLWVALGIAVLKYRLYGIDIVISKAVLYGSLAVFITAVYAALVVGVGTLAGNQRSPLLAALAAAVVAVAFQPAPAAGRAARQPRRVRQAGHPVSGPFAVRPAHRSHLRQPGRAAADGADRGGRDRRRTCGRVAAGS
jgi:hypothetical protein